MTREEIIQALAGMPASELLEVRRCADALIALSGSTLRGEERSWELDCVCDALARRGLGAQVAVWRRSGDLADFRRRLPDLREFLTAAGNRDAQQAVLTEGVDLICGQLASWGVVVTARSVVRNLDKLPAVLDRAYPGYAASGLLGWIGGIRR